MPKGKFIRGLAALLMILALVLPVSPGFAADEQNDGEVRAADLLPGPGAPGPNGGLNTINSTTLGAVPTNFATYDRADCPPVGEDTGITVIVAGVPTTPVVGKARYVVTIDKGDGTNNANGVSVSLVGTGTANLGQIIPMTQGDSEPSAFDGSPCYFSLNCGAGLNAQDSAIHQLCGLTADLQPASTDLRQKEFVSPFVKSHNPTNYGTAPNPVAGLLAGSVNAADGWTWDLLIKGVGPTRRYNLSLITDNRGAANGITPAFPDPDGAGPLTATPTCGIDTFACNIGLGTVNLVGLPTQSGYSNLSGTVNGPDNQPRGSVTVVVTDVFGGIHTTLTNALGYYSFPSACPVTAGVQVCPAGQTATPGDFIPAGDAWIVVADNINDYICAGPFPQNCGNLPASAKLTVVSSGGAVKDFMLVDKAAPSAAETALSAGTAGVFGYVVNNKPPGEVPVGVGGIRIDAFLGAATPGAATVPAATTFTDPGTGRWRMNGLLPATVYTFVASTANATNPATNFQVNTLACAITSTASTNPNINPLGVTAGTCIDTLTTGAAGTWTDPVFVIVTPPARLVAVPPIGTGFITGIITDANGAAVAGTTVVLYRLNQAPGSAGVAVLASGAVWAVQTDLNGQYFFGNLPPGVAGCTPLAPLALGSGTGCNGLPYDTYTVTALDTRFPEQCATGISVTAPPTNICGGLPAAQQVALGPAFPGSPFIGPGVASNNGVAVVNFQLQPKVAPGGVACLPGLAGCVPQNTVSPTSTTLAASQIGIFGYVVESAAGTRIPGATVLISPAAVAPAIGFPGVPGCTASTLAGCVVAQTDAAGRYQATVSAGQAYTVAIILPPGFLGACTVGAVGLCTIGASFTQFAVPANLLGGFWYDGGTFALGPSSAVSGVPNGQVAESLQAVALPIYRNPDTTFTGVDIETVQVRVMNNGSLRTGVRIDWWQTSSDEVASLAKTDGFDLNPGAVAIFTRTFVPDGCTRCYAEIYSVDLDLTGLNYGLSDLQATVTNRVVEADNAIAGHNATTNEDLFPPITQTQLGFAGTNPQGFAVNCIPGTYGCPTGISTAWYLPTVYKNYGGGANKWSSVVSACLSRGSLTTGLTPAQVAGQNGVFTNPISGLPFTGFNSGGQPMVYTFFPISGSTAPNGPFAITRFAQPGGCSVINLNAPDPDNPDYGGIDILPTGAYAVEITSTGGLLAPNPFIAAGVNRPNGFFAAAVSYTITGKMAFSASGASSLLAEPTLAPFTGPANTIRALYSALIFKRYNDWNSGIVVVNKPVNSGGSNSDITITLYGEDGTVMGSFVDQIGGESARVYYMPTFPIQLPDGFRGSVVISAINSAGTTFLSSSTSGRLSAGAVHLNYERNQAIATNFFRQDALPLSASQLAGGTGLGEAQFVNPCFLATGSGATFNPATGGSLAPINIAAGAFPLPGAVITTGALGIPLSFGSVPNCLAAPAVERQVASDPVTRSEVPSGPTTGLRLYNPDPSRSGQAAYVSVTYLDPSGVIQAGSVATLTIPPMGTATIFLGADARLPDFFTGTAIIVSDQPIIGIGNVVDYGVRTRDGSWAYTLVNQRGFTS